MACKGSSVRVRSAPPFSGRMTHSMADIAQLVRALVCGTKCRRFESGYPPHHKKAPQRGVFYDVWAVRTRTAGSERQLTRTRVNAVRVLRSERGPLWRRATDGNLQSGYPPHHKKAPQRGVFFMMSGRFGREPQVRNAQTDYSPPGGGVFLCHA